MTVADHINQAIDAAASATGLPRGRVAMVIDAALPHLHLAQLAARADPTVIGVTNQFCDPKQPVDKLNT